MTEKHDFTSERRTAVNFRRHSDYERCPKFDKHELSEDQIVEIAKKAVALAREEFYQEVGKSVTSKFFVLVGLAAMATMVWLTRKGYIG
jgi:hypothetical protein